MDVVSCSLLDVAVSKVFWKMSSIYEMIEMIERKRGREEGGVDGRTSKPKLVPISHLM